MIKFISFILLFIVTNTYSEVPFSGKILKSSEENISMKDETSGKVKTLPKGVELLVLSEEQAKQLPNYNPERYYYKVANLKGHKGKVYSLNDGTFDKVTQKGKFGNWIKKEYIANYQSSFEQKYSNISPQKRTSPKASSQLKPKKKKIKKSPVQFELQRDYTIKNDHDPVELIDPVDGKVNHLTPGINFYAVRSRGTLYIIVPPHDTRFKLKKPSQIYNIFQQGDVNSGNYITLDEPDLPQDELEDSPEKASKSKSQKEDPTAEKLEREPDEEDSAWLALKSFNFIERISNYFEDDEETGTNNEKTTQSSIECEPKGQQAHEMHKPIVTGKLPYNKCNAENNYLESKLKDLIDPIDLRETETHACVLAGLKNAKSIEKFAQCQNGKLISSKKPICASQNYVAFIAKELDQIADCFPNINSKELIPLVNAESRFNHNAYNENLVKVKNPNYEKSDQNEPKYIKKNVLNASGLLQSTQVLIKSQDRSYISNPSYIGLKKNKYCQSLIKGIVTNPLSEQRNVCERTSLPKGLRKNLYIATAQYAYLKKRAENEIKDLQTDYLGSKKDMISPAEMEKIKISLARLMHNRGMGTVDRMIEMFFYDLFHGGHKNAQSKVRKNKHGKKVYHGNAKIYKLWGRPGFKAPLKHEEFIQYFSSYIFYENGKRSKGRKTLANAKYLDAEGGTYIHKMTCEEELLNKKASDLAKKRINCGGSQTTDNMLEKTQVEVGWYYNVCKKQNNSLSSQRLCTAKDPYKAKTSSGKRRLSNNMIKKFRSREKLLRLCDHESLRGMASRPLKEFYSGK